MGPMDEFCEWEVRKLKEHGLDTAPAQAAQLPAHSGDGYGFGGGAVVVIGGRAIVIGEGDGMLALAKEIARRWNAGL